MGVVVLGRVIKRPSHHLVVFSMIGIVSKKTIRLRCFFFAPSIGEAASGEVNTGLDPVELKDAFKSKYSMRVHPGLATTKEGRVYDLSS